MFFKQHLSNNQKLLLSDDEILIIMEYLTFSEWTNLSLINQQWNKVSKTTLVEILILNLVMETRKQAIVPKG